MKPSRIQLRNHQRREKGHFDCNASAALGIMDIFLSFPQPSGRARSRAARTLEQVVRRLEALSLAIEPRTVLANERLLELPFIWQRLPPSGRILELGSNGSPLALQLATMGYDVAAVDVLGYPFSHPNLTIYQNDITACDFEESSFDCAVLISVIEHVGLGHYGDKGNISDQHVLDLVAKSVRRSGLILLTVPYGKRFSCDWYRVYDQASLSELLSPYDVIDMQFARRHGPFEWHLCPQDELASVSSKRLPMQGVALVQIQRPETRGVMR